MIAIARELWAVVIFCGFLAGISFLLAWVNFRLYARRKLKRYQFYRWGWVVAGVMWCVAAIKTALGY
jgi:allophanate hydrolase subunit 1